MSASMPPQAADLTQRFALDTQGFEALKHSARNGADAATLQSAARQFEAVFTQMVLKSMRNATPQDGLFDNEQSKLYMSMMDQQLAQQMSSRGIGLAEVMVRQLARAAGAPMPAGMNAMTPAESGSAADAQMARLLDSRGAASADGNEYADLPAVGTVVPGQSWNPTAGLRQYQSQFYGDRDQGGEALGPLPADAPAHVSAFVARMAAPAEAASRASGVPARLIVGQAALESGWGQREILHADGSTTYNVFGIKAGSGWKGRVAEITTTEYVDGQPQKVKARFRAYGSYDEACADYARLLASNPRYAGVVSAGSAEEAAHGLQRAGYATDPSYGHKLVKIMKKVAV
ncbi:flagellar assembly peptidoglycan hydrolase FlgJ [Cupriavidus consociatus]|uniref:flagellar assembly peptidoglycan hydrolase FlgJ n=1 Tax=Cupriavidus consociatus TaxID=2821357 RepID=UPI001AE59ACE|nr:MULTISPECIES: flagellar assembly peptidoglycan hydrolase FlgJ [unclassified Cupriavidus]MBP0621137.1 flagellar assembly peptidoglycan hydrolase FlgJ [Cupriavidus sp. LEh25]MDK2657806.1 flagellar assembly peptidoglycan hydrolase FlgJ [Cupriavidus sp. LEh21]